MIRSFLVCLALVAGLLAAFVAIADAKEPPAASAISTDGGDTALPPAARAVLPAPDSGTAVAVVGEGWG